MALLSAGTAFNGGFFDTEKYFRGQSPRYCGIDRLVMLLTDSQTIRDVILFPQMRPE